MLVKITHSNTSIEKKSKKKSIYQKSNHPKNEINQQREKKNENIKIDYYRFLILITINEDVLTEIIIACLTV